MGGMKVATTIQRPSAAYARFTSICWNAPHVRTSDSPAWPTRLTCAWVLLPPGEVYGRLTTSHSPVSSERRSPIFSCIGGRRTVPGGGRGCTALAFALFPGRGLAIHATVHLP